MVDLVPDGTELLGGLELGGVPIATRAQRAHRAARAVRAQAGQGVRHLQAGRGPGRRRPAGARWSRTSSPPAARYATRPGRCARPAPSWRPWCARSTGARGSENPLADVGLEVRPVLTKAELDAAAPRLTSSSPDGCSPSRRRPGRRCPAAGGWPRRRLRLAVGAGAPPLVGDRDHREGQDHDDRLVDVLAQRRERGAEEVAEQRDADDPQRPRRRRSRGRTGARSIRVDAGDDGDVGAHERHEPADAPAPCCRACRRSRGSGRSTCA